MSGPADALQARAFPAWATIPSYQDLATGRADVVYFTDGGLIVESGKPAEFFANPADERTKFFLSKVL